MLPQQGSSGHRPRGEVRSNDARLVGVTRRLYELAANSGLVLAP